MFVFIELPAYYCSTWNWFK